MEPLDEIAGDSSLTNSSAHPTALSKGLLLLLLLLALGNWASISHLLRDANGAQDFSIFYTGAKIVWGGHAKQLYDLSVQAHDQTNPGYQVRPLPFDHPAFELIPFLPLALLPFNAAYILWGLASLAFAWTAARLLAPRLVNFPNPRWLWAFAIAMASFPLVWATAQGQDSVLLFLIFALVYLNLKSHKDLLAGAVLAVGLFKFTLVLPFVFVFLLLRRWKFLAGFALGAAAVAGLSVAITGIGGARQYVQLLTLLLAHPEVGYINPTLMPNVRGFLITVLAGSGLSRTMFECLAAACSLLLLIAPVLASHGDDERSELFDLWFGLTLTVAVLASAHLYWHDMTVLLLPILLALNVVLKPPPFHISKSAIAWGLAYACAWPVYLLVSPSYFFPVSCVLVFWFLKRIRSAGHGAVTSSAVVNPTAVTPT